MSDLSWLNHQTYAPLEPAQEAELWDRLWHSYSEMLLLGARVSPPDGAVDERLEEVVRHPGNARRRWFETALDDPEAAARLERLTEFVRARCQGPGFDLGDAVAALHSLRTEVGATRTLIAEVARSHCEAVLNSPDLAVSEEDRERLEVLRDEASRARETLMKRNLRLVRHFVFRVAKFLRNSEERKEDLFQSGVLGLAEAVERFDPDRGARFSSYAAFWIQREIREASQRQQRAFELTRGANELLARLRRERHRFKDEHRREPTIAELADAIQKKKQVVLELLILDHPEFRLDGQDGADTPHPHETIGYDADERELSAIEREMFHSYMKGIDDQLLEAFDAVSPAGTSILRRREVNGIDAPDRFEQIVQSTLEDFERRMEEQREVLRSVFRRD